MTFQDLLDEAFPPEVDANIIRGVTEGIYLADTILESAGFLQSLVGQDLRGHLRRAGMLYRLHQMAMAGDIPLESTMTKMPRGNWHWVELRNKNFAAHVCRTNAPDAFPDDTPTRQDDRLTNQGDLFKDTSAVIPIKGYAAWLTFGVGDSGALGHLCWGMPNAKEDIWLARTNIIRRAQERDVVVSFEAPEKATKLKFRDHIEEALKGKEEEHGDKPA
jgi:hypothetical protein